MNTSSAQFGSRKKLYRTILVCATAASLLLSIPAQAQTKKRKGPRAIAVVRWDADAKDMAVPELVPVTILDDGRFYDASVYKATPAPMPLEMGTVYEAQDKGELLGYFTVKVQARIHAKQNWVGMGEWQGASPPADNMAGNRKSSLEVVQGKMGEQTGTNPGDNNDDRELKKKSTTVYDENGKPMPEGTTAAPAAPMGGAGDTKPTLKKGSDSSQTGSSKNPDASKGADAKTGSGEKKAPEDPDRPTIKRQNPTPPPPATTAPADDRPAQASPASKPENDPDRPALKRNPNGENVAYGAGGVKMRQLQGKDADRPVIRRGKPEKGGVGDSKAIPVPPRVLDRGPLLAENTSDTFALHTTRTYEAVAVSDATIDPPQNFHFKMGADEKETLQTKMDALAQREVDAYLKSIGRTRAGEPTATPTGKASAQRITPPKLKGSKAVKPATPAKSLFAETRFEVFDLSHRNDAILVFSGRERMAAAPGASTGINQDVYVVYIANIDLQGEPHGLFRSVTVNDRLDITPKLELIDAVDATGSGRGELLFRRVNGDGAEFAIYHANYDGLKEIFHGGVAD